MLLVVMIAMTAIPVLAWPRLPRFPHKTHVENKSLRLRHIAGVIVDQKGLFIPYPAIELRDANDHHVIATSFADGNGRFHFEDRKPGEVLEIRFSVKGYQPAQYTIDVVRIGHESMKAVMQAAP
ncbi:MAG TPA: carboxypeptidase-like regulatory domain-containing protein [Acidobacteriaceae bacterium]|nr:carboxypeptidase-like regulatory domain-containing protein [Acidobacteriaceae bacterium]